MECVGVLAPSSLPLPRTERSTCVCVCVDRKREIPLARGRSFPFYKSRERIGIQRIERDFVSCARRDLPRCRYIPRPTSLVDAASSTRGPHRAYRRHPPPRPGPGSSRCVLCGVGYVEASHRGIARPYPTAYLTLGCDRGTLHCCCVSARPVAWPSTPLSVPARCR